MMAKNSKTDRIRTLLRDKHMGLKAEEIAESLGIKIDYVRVLLNHMPDTYIQRWSRTRSAKGYLAVWNVAHVPPDAKRPKSAPIERRDFDAKDRQKLHDAAKAVARAAKRAAEKSSIGPAATATVKTTWVTPPPWAN